MISFLTWIVLAFFSIGIVLAYMKYPKRMIVINKTLLLLIGIKGIYTAYAVPASDCDEFAVRAYQLQLDRQHGIMSDWQPDTAMEWDMKNNVWQHPQFKGEKKRAARARLFADDWKQVCLAGWYK